MKKAVVIVVILSVGFLVSWYAFGYFGEKLASISIENIVARTIHKGIKIHSSMVQAVEPTITNYVTEYNANHFEFICQNMIMSQNSSKCTKQLEFAKYDLGNIENYDLKNSSISLKIKKINLYEYYVKSSFQYQNKKDVDMEIYILFNKRNNEFKINEIVFDELDIY